MGSIVPQRVVLLSASVGAGHNQAAGAIKEGLRLARPELEVDFRDTLQFISWSFRTYYQGGYTLLVTRLPWLYGVGYRLTGGPTSPRRTLWERLRLAQERLALRRLRAWLLEDRRPTLVICTHFLPLSALEPMLALGQLPHARVWVTMTDYEAHRWWYAPSVERYYVATEPIRDAVVAWGIDPAAVTVSGIPVHPKWTAPLDRADIYRRWNLPRDVPIVILSGGTFFTVGPIARMAQAVLARTPAHVVVLAGNNKPLLAELAALPEAAGGRLSPVPFTDKVHELAEVASLIVTKPGGLMTTECQAKGVAMVLTKPVPGQEQANADMLVREGAAVLAPSPDEIVRQVEALLADHPRLQSLRDNARRLHRPATKTIVDDVMATM